MKHNVITGSKLPIKAWTSGVTLEAEALGQLYNLANMPFIHKHVAVMPDVHAGKGATIGSVIATKGAIIPAAVGVDIGCGMMAVRTALTASDMPDNLHAIRSAIEAAVPHGRSDNGGANDKGAWSIDVPRRGHVNDHCLTHAVNLPSLAPLFSRYPKLARAADRAKYQLGTLGTGNHFIEVCLDEAQRVWVMLHSGSRGIGNAIGNHFIELAKKDMERWFIHLPDKDLSYIPQGSTLFDDYFEAVNWAQLYADLNRRVMMMSTLQAIVSALGKPIAYHPDAAVNCHHNYVNWEYHFGENVMVTRKGAVSAKNGQLGIIPGSMGARSFIVRGKGNIDSFHSCSHGAGRVMSRTKARATFSIEDHESATAGVECRKDADVLDETPGAYKDIDAVMRAQEDLVDIVHTLKQVVCVKG